MKKRTRACFPILIAVSASCPSGSRSCWPRWLFQCCCLKLGPFSAGAMLRWPAGPKACDGIWACVWWSVPERPTRPPLFNARPPQPNSTACVWNAKLPIDLRSSEHDERWRRAGGCIGVVGLCVAAAAAGITGTTRCTSRRGCGRRRSRRHPPCPRRSRPFSRSAASYMQSLHRTPSTPSAARRCEGSVRIWRRWRARRAEWTACVREDVPNATAARKLSPRAVPVDDEEPMDRQMIANNEVSLASQPKRPMSDFPTERNSHQMRKTNRGSAPLLSCSSSCARRPAQNRRTPK